MTVVAMANTKSGMIFLGMDIKNYHLYGFSDTVDTLRQFIQTHCRPQINIVTDIIEKNGKDILVLRINQTANQMDNQKDNRPYYYKNMCYIMEGTTPRLALIEKSNLPLKVETQTTLDVDQQPKNSVLNTRQTEALEYIQLESSIKNRDYRDLFDVSHKTAHLELVDMVSKGLISSSGQGRSTHYVVA
jgi:predicted HTH transcriptional regulator